MTGRRFRWLIVGLLASAGAGLLMLTSTMNAAFAFGVVDESAIMGGTDNPLPDPDYITAVNGLYIDPAGGPIFTGQTVYPGYNPNGLYTPEQFWPVTGLTDMTFGKSVAAGVTNLDTAIRSTYAGDNLVVFGYSQSATIATIEMRNLMASGYDPSPNSLAFVLISDPNNPNGGILERFAGLYIPILNVWFNGATPPDTPFPTDIYSIQYEGVANTPQFPINPVSDLNALAGYLYLHTTDTYQTLTPAELATAVQLPTSPGYTGVTDYYMIPTQNLPLLDPLRQIPYLGPVMAELIQPDMRVLVDLGYGDGYANVPTTAGLIPLFNPIAVCIDLVRGAEQGVVAALVQSGALPASDLPTSYPYLPDPASGLSTSLWNLLTGNSQQGIIGVLTGDPHLLSGNPLPDLLPGGGPLGLPDVAALLPGVDVGTLLPSLDLGTLLPGVGVGTLLPGLPGSLLGLPDALGLALDPTWMFSVFGLLLG